MDLDNPEAYPHIFLSIEESLNSDNSIVFNVSELLKFLPFLLTGHLVEV